MQFNVAQLLKQPTGSTRKYEVNESLDDLDPELVIQAPIQGRVKFTKIPQGVLANGTFSTVVEMNCSRCLDPFDVPVTIEVEEEFRPSIDLQTGARIPHSEDEDQATIIDDKHIIDLSEVVRQDLFIGLPSLPVCREACKGLCPQCGQNLNEGPCDCPTETVDHRWAALRALLDDSSNGTSQA